MDEKQKAQMKTVFVAFETYVTRILIAAQRPGTNATMALNSARESLIETIAKLQDERD
jgi:hypothetical protein